MGIDVQAFTRRRPKKLFGQMSAPDTLKAIDTAARDWAQTNELGPFFRSATQDGTLYVWIYALTEALEFRASGEGLSLGVRTSNGGPGYHAAIIDLLDALGQKLGVNWDYGSAADCGDETGFALSRDFSDLQRAHTHFFQSIMNICADSAQNGSTQLAVCLPVGLSAGIDQGIATPLGILPIERAFETAEMNDADLSMAAAEFFPWWPKAREPLFWRSTLRGLLWTMIAWRPVHTEDDAYFVAAARHARDKVRLTSGGLPADLEEACRDFEHALANGAALPVRATDAIGYRRRTISHNVFRGWWIELPGTLIEESLDDGGAVQFYDDDTAMRLSSLLIDAPAGSAEPVKWLDDFEDLPGDILPHAELRLQPPPPPDEDGLIHQFGIVMHTYDGGASMLLCTITYATPEQGDALRARLRTIRFQPDDPQTQRASVN